MEYLPLIQGVVIFVGLFISLSLFRVAFSVWQSNNGEYEMNRARCGDSIWNILTGNVKTRNGLQRDFRGKAGIAVRNGEWISQGTLSEEAIDSIIRE
ncbi:hypothetical protein RYZ26_01155 [Terasakiella sp. A23]|uniref:hypothetical protein n=1 Tax=Terasakiella sp. FCG-A23 TaxID=3080561 RepID=UPI002954D639|nr:hypothetical protein [Terasakiella sp. A23]MDV7338183.1 hypothetical protein [Terasakiella sp. A23]